MEYFFVTLNISRKKEEEVMAGGWLLKLLAQISWKYFPYVMISYLSNDLVIDEKHEGHHKANPEHQIGCLQQILKINSDLHSWCNL